MTKFQLKRWGITELRTFLKGIINPNEVQTHYDDVAVKHGSHSAKGTS